MSAMSRPSLVALPALVATKPSSLSVFTSKGLSTTTSLSALFCCGAIWSCTGTGFGSVVGEAGGATCCALALASMSAAPAREDSREGRSDGWRKSAAKTLRIIVMG